MQKLTGSLGQTIRETDPNEFTSENIKYVLNSIISALDLTNLNPEDKSEIINNLGDDDLNEVIQPQTNEQESVDGMSFISKFINEVKRHNRDLGEKILPYYKKMMFKNKLREIEKTLKSEREEKIKTKYSIEEND